MTINTAYLAEGQCWHVRSVYGFEGPIIRCALSRWARRLARSPADQVVIPEAWTPDDGCWGNHDGIVTKRGDHWGIGEQTLSGAKFTPLDVYLAGIEKGRYQVRVYEPIAASASDMAHGTANWWQYLRGRPYDFIAYLPRLTWKALVSDWADSSVAWKRRIGRTPSGWEWAGWCTEDFANSYRIKPPGRDLLQTANPTPLTMEQCAGQAPRRPRVQITLRDVTRQVFDETA